LLDLGVEHVIVKLRLQLLKARSKLSDNVRIERQPIPVVPFPAHGNPPRTRSIITEWTDSARPVVESLQEETLTKQAVEDATDEVDNATTTLAGELRDLGTPDTEAGEQVEASVQRLSSELDDDVEQIDTAVNNATDPSGVRTAVSEASSTLVTMGNRVPSTVSELDRIDAKGELKAAFQESDSCQSLSQQGLLSKQDRSLL
jgi:hypothetical protein